MLHGVFSIPWLIVKVIYYTVKILLNLTCIVKLFAGEKNGYNIPEMISVPELPQWLSDDGSRVIIEKSIKDKVLPEHAKRLFCDAYMCMYQSTDVMMYH